MAFVALGVLFILMNLLGIGWPADWEWKYWGLFKLLWPFGAAALWWAFSDSMGYTQRREMDKMDEKKEKRRRDAMQSLGLQNPKRRR